jgi:hypothetical protein
MHEQGKSTMDIQTFNAILAHQDQFIAQRMTTFGFVIVLYAENRETVNTITTIARSAGLKVRRRIIDKGAPDAEAHLLIH